ncbi:MAG: TlpA family protein disulfide reductase [Chloroflexi bacterium]|nr:TlpA family protein disulfide reductase [Chloroflexota bacterium]
MVARILRGVLPWAVVGFQSWLVYTLMRQHGRSLLSQDALTERLGAAEEALRDVEQSVRQLGAGAGHDHALEPADQGLSIGSPAPEFELPDLDGRPRHLRDFLGRPLLVVFFNTGCGFCRQMAPRLGQLPADGPGVLLVSRGDPEEHREWARENNWRCDVVLEPDWTVATAYQTNGTPTGYLLDAQGRVASSLAIGADALLDLVTAAPIAAGQNGHAHGLSADDLLGRAEAAAAHARAAAAPTRPSTIVRDGLPAGSEAPDFDLPDLEGVHHRLSDYRGTRVLLVFSDPGCAPCQAMASELEQARRRSGGKLTLLVISRGDPDVNRARAREQAATYPILLQNQWEISRLYGMFAIPIAFLIDENGVIEQDVAVGMDAIGRLVQ